MKIKDKLYKLIVGDDDIEVSKILLDFGFRWFLFGLGLGIMITCLIFNFN